MKKGLWIVTLVLLMATGCFAYASSPQTGYPPNAGGQNFGGPQQYGPDMGMDSVYDQLAPYGNWVILDPYGYVWIPRYMGYRWRPYTEGHWIMTDFGWTWIANEEWGSIPFHYGRWGYDNDFGWFWVPGTVWGPAWVSWRSNDQYMGWAPLPPGVEFRAGMDFASLSFNIPDNFWVFLQAPYFLDNDLYRYTLPYERNVTIINYTVINNNIFFRDNRIMNEGVGIDFVRRVTQRQVPSYRIRDVQQPGRTRLAGNDVEIFRPALRAAANAKPKVFLNRAEARQELAAAKIFEPRQQLAVKARESAVLKRQAEEQALLEKTQAQELKAAQRKQAAEEARILDKAEKEKTRQDQQTKMAELRKQQQAEKQQLTERQKQGTEFELRQQPSAKAQESAVRKRQAEEQALLEKTQAQDLKVMQRKQAAEEARILDKAEKEKTRQDQQTKIAELRKQQQAEKQQLTERHKQDTEQVKKVAERAKKEKPAPTVKKKKVD